VKLLAAVAAALAAICADVAPALAETPLTAKTSVSTSRLYFGEPITARVTVVADRRQVDPASLRVSASFGDWDLVARERTKSLSSGPYVRRSWEFDIACVQSTCLPRPGTPLPVHLPSVTVAGTRPDGSRVVVRRSWPALAIAPRFGAASQGSMPKFDLDRELPAATYRVSPSSLVLGLYVLAAVLIAFALWIVGREVLRRRPRAVAELPPLVRALMLVRESETRPTEDRRRAAGLLARTLAADGRRGPLSATASRVAWSAPEPAPSRLEELARLVETTPEESS
jgi:hypothetical protein